MGANRLVSCIPVLSKILKNKEAIFTGSDDIEYPVSAEINNEKENTIVGGNIRGTVANHLFRERPSVPLEAIETHVDKAQTVSLVLTIVLSGKFAGAFAILIGHQFVVHQ